MSDLQFDEIICFKKKKVKAYFAKFSKTGNCLANEV